MFYQFTILTHRKIKVRKKSTNWYKKCIAQTKVSLTFYMQDCAKFRVLKTVLLSVYELEFELALNQSWKNVLNFNGCICATLVWEVFFPLIFQIEAFAKTLYAINQTNQPATRQIKTLQTLV